MKENFKIRRLEKDDAPAVHQLSCAIPELSPWSLSDFESFLDSGFAGWVAENEKGIAGFLLTRCVSDEMEILKLGAAPDFRRRGMASALLTAAFVPAVSQGIRRVFLEVRASNAEAISLYRTAGFRVTGRRRNYYSAPVEDALLMGCEIQQSPHFPLGG